MWPAIHPQFPGRLELHNATAAENPALVQLGAQTAAIETEYVEAVDSERAILAEWRPRWPDAPKDIQCGRGYNGALERGIDGWAIRRRDEHGREYSQQISTAIELHGWVEQVELEMRRAKSTRSRRGGAQALEEFKRQLRVAVEYESECARIRRVSGFDAVRSRRQAAEKRLADHISAILREEAHTVNGIVMQALAVNAARDLPLLFRSALEVECGMNWGSALAASVVRSVRGVTA